MMNLQNNQTAMQELWSYVKDDKTIPFEHYRKLRNKILPLIEKEKEQIIEVCVEFSNHGKEMALERAKEYYTETYGT